MKILLLACSLAAPALADLPHTVFNPDALEETQVLSWKYHHGDNPEWSKLTSDDVDWQLIGKHEMPISNKGIFWLRTRILLTGSSNNTPVILRIGYLQSAYEVYWDGEIVASNGIVGRDKEGERPGNLHFVVPIPRASDDNDSVHLLSLRCSNFHASTPTGEIAGAKLESSRLIRAFNQNSLLRISLLVGVGFACCILSLALYLAGGRFRSYVYASFLCLALVVSKGMELLLGHWNAPMTVMGLVDTVYIAGFYLAEISIFLYFIYSFGIPGKRYHVPALLLVSLVFYLYNLQEAGFRILNYDIYRIAVVPYGYVLLFLAVRRKRRGSIVATVVYVLYPLPPIFYVAGIISIPITPLIIDLSRGVLLLFPVVISALQVHEQQILQKSVEQRAQRLEIELLKKTIQPHFIVNTLSSVKSLARRDPEKADKLIQALANEFRILNDILVNKEIPVMQEIELCEYHLQVMGYRWDASYKFVTKGIPEEEMIPPLILHTLVENGLTHAFKPKESGTFWLTYEEQNGDIRYRMQNDGSLLDGIKSTSNLEEGMGLRYVKARLEERYPQRWSVNYGVKGSKWEVLIQIREKG